MEPIALGELGLTIQEFGDCTVGQISALTRAYARRRDALEDLFIIYSALPTYQTQLGRKSPTYKKLTAHRNKREAAKHAELTPAAVEHWREVLQEG